MDAHTYTLAPGADMEGELTLVDRYQGYEGWHRGYGRGCWSKLELVPLLLLSGNGLSMSDDYPGVIILKGHFEEKDVRAAVGMRGLPFGVSHLKGLDNSRLPFKPNFS